MSSNLTYSNYEKNYFSIFFCAAFLGIVKTEHCMESGI